MLWPRSVCVAAIVCIVASVAVWYGTRSEAIGYFMAGIIATACVLQTYMLMRPATKHKGASHRMADNTFRDAIGGSRDAGAGYGACVGSDAGNDGGNNDGSGDTGDVAIASASDDTGGADKGDVRRANTDGIAITDGTGIATTDGNGNGIAITDGDGGSAGDAGTDGAIKGFVSPIGTGIANTDGDGTGGASRASKCDSDTCAQSLCTKFIAACEKIVDVVAVYSSRLTADGNQAAIFSALSEISALPIFTYLSTAEPGVYVSMIAGWPEYIHASTKNTLLQKFNMHDGTYTAHNMNMLVGILTFTKLKYYFIIGEIVRFDMDCNPQLYSKTYKGLWEYAAAISQTHAILYDVSHITRTDIHRLLPLCGFTNWFNKVTTAIYDEKIPNYFKNSLIAQDVLEYTSNLPAITENIKNAINNTKKWSDSIVPSKRAGILLNHLASCTKHSTLYAILREPPDIAKSGDSINTPELCCWLIDAIANLVRKRYIITEQCYHIVCIKNALMVFLYGKTVSQTLPSVRILLQLLITSRIALLNYINTYNRQLYMFADIYNVTLSEDIAHRREEANQKVHSLLDKRAREIENEVDVDNYDTRVPGELVLNCNCITWCKQYVCGCWPKEEKYNQ